MYKLSGEDSIELKENLRFDIFVGVLVPKFPFAVPAFKLQISVVVESVKSRFNLSSDKVLSLQKEIVRKAILYAVLKRMQADHNTTYTRHRLLREIDEHYAWLDVNASRRKSDIRDLIDSSTEQHCVRELWATRNPVEPFNMDQYLPELPR